MAFKTTLTAFTVAASLALLPASGAHAQGIRADQTLGLLAGLAALAIIGNKIGQDRRKRHHPPVIQRHAPIAPVAPPAIQRRPPPKSYARGGRRVLPGNCVRTLETHRGVMRDVLGLRCLERNGVRTTRLPDRCLRDVRTNRGWRTAYGLGCLRHDGYRLTAGPRYRN